MAVQPKRFITVEEYLILERESNEKHEYVNGEIFAMGGASPNHGLIVTNVIGELRTQLKKRPCTIYPTDLRVKINPTGLYAYPDVVVVCGEPQFDDDNKDTLINPTLIVEVLSETTKDYDRGGKFAHYRTLSSFLEYILIAQDTPHIEYYTRQPDNRWIFAETSRLEDVVELESIGCTLSLAEVYDKVRLI